MHSSENNVKDLTAAPPSDRVLKHFPHSLSTTFAAFKHHNYRLWFSGQMISLIGTWMQNLAQPWLVYELTGSPLYLGIVSFASAIPSFTLSLWAGVIIDRMSKRRLLIITQIAMMALAFLLALDVALGLVQWWHIAIMAVFLGSVQAFDAPTRHAFVIELVGRNELMNAIALNSAMFNSARILGPTIAGIVLATAGPVWCFLLNGVSFAAVLIGLLMMSFPPITAKPRNGTPWEQMREGLRYIYHNQTIRSLLLLVAVANIFAVGYSALLPAFAKDVLDAGEIGLGLMSAAVGIGALVAALTVASLGNFQRKGLLLTFGNILLPCMVLCFAASKWLPLSLIFLAGAGFGFMIQNATANTLIQTTVEDDKRGRVMSLYMMVFQGFFPISALIAGYVANHYTIPIGAAFGGVIALTFSLYFTWRVPYIRRLT